MEEKNDKKPEEPIVDEKGDKELYVDYFSGEIRDTTEYVPWGISSFAEYDESVENQKITEKAKKDAFVYQRLVDRIFDNDELDKNKALVDLAKEFVARTEETVSDETKEKETIRPLPFMVFKSKSDDVYKFVTLFSNNARDQDNPSEIIASESHERFVKMVDAGESPLPELLLWHIEDWKLGQTEVVAFDKEAGIAVASGYFHKEAEPIAQHIAENPEFWGVSHGFDSVKRSDEDATVIIEHTTKEISPLPAFAAANKWANFLVLKENKMSLTQEKKQQLVDQGVEKDLIEALESSIENTNEQIDKSGVERKEETPAEEIVEETPEEETVSEEKEVEELAEETPEEEVEQVFSKKQVEELAGAFAKMSETIVAQVMEQVKEVVAPVIEKTEKQEKEVEEFLGQTPSFSLEEMLFSGKRQKEQSALSSEDTEVDGRTTFAKQKPEEVAQVESIVNSGNAIADGVIANLFAPANTEETV